MKLIKLLVVWLQAITNHLKEYVEQEELRQRECAARRQLAESKWNSDRARRTECLLAEYNYYVKQGIMVDQMTSLKAGAIHLAILTQNLRQLTDGNVDGIEGNLDDCLCMAIPALRDCATRQKIPVFQGRYDHCSVEELASTIIIPKIAVVHS